MADPFSIQLKSAAISVILVSDNDVGMGHAVVNVLLDDQSLVFILQSERTLHVYSVEDNKLDRVYGLVIPVTVGVPVKV